MKDVVEKILKEEEKASKILQDAKEAADCIVKDAKKEKENIIDKAIKRTIFDIKKKKQQKKDL
mgnify:CR=1 FL=1